MSYFDNVIIGGDLDGVNDALVLLFKSIKLQQNHPFLASQEHTDPTKSLGGSLKSLVIKVRKKAYRTYKSSHSRTGENENFGPFRQETVLECIYSGLKPSRGYLFYVERY